MPTVVHAVDPDRIRRVKVEKDPPFADSEPIKTCPIR
jgi:hypothetical protein